MAKVNTLMGVIDKTAKSQVKLIKTTIDSLKGNLVTSTGMGGLFKSEQVSALKSLKNGSKEWLKASKNLQLKGTYKGKWSFNKSINGYIAAGAIGLSAVQIGKTLYNKGTNYNLKTEAYGKRGQDSAGMLGQASLEGLKFKPLKNRKYI